MRVSIIQSKHGLTPWVVALTAVAWAPLSPAVARPPQKAQKASISEDDVRAAQAKWCQDFLKIGETYRQPGGDYRGVANRFLDDLYAFQEGAVFFKPTLASGDRTFRTTKADALSYFITPPTPPPGDIGFALKEWTRCRYANKAGIKILPGDIGIAMGHVCLTPPQGRDTVADMTFVFRKSGDGKLRLIAHHSSESRGQEGDPCATSSPAKSKSGH